MSTRKVTRTGHTRTLNGKKIVVTPHETTVRGGAPAMASDSFAGSDPSSHDPFGDQPQPEPEQRPIAQVYEPMGERYEHIYGKNAKKWSVTGDFRNPWSAETENAARVRVYDHLKENHPDIVEKQGGMDTYRARQDYYADTEEEAQRLAAAINETQTWEPMPPAPEKTPVEPYEGLVSYGPSVEGDGYTVTGHLGMPEEYADQQGIDPWQDETASNYGAQDRLAKYMKENHPDVPVTYDSESGQFWVYTDTEENAKTLARACGSKEVAPWHDPESARRKDEAVKTILDNIQIPDKLEGLEGLDDRQRDAVRDSLATLKRGIAEDLRRSRNLERL